MTTGEGESDKKDSEDLIGNIDIGDSLPSITLKNEKGEDVDIANLAAEKGVILFLVPKADTRQFPGFFLLSLSSHGVDAHRSGLHQPSMRLP